MKIAVLGDTHFGVRGGSEYFLSKQIDFFQRFFDYLIQNQIKHVIQLGDLFDNRKYVDLKVLHQVKNEVFKKFDELGIEMYWLLGNHDTYYKSTLKVNSRYLLDGVKTVNVIDTIGSYDVGCLRIDIFPWINSENVDHMEEFLKGKKSRVAVGHFAFDGFDMYRGIPARGGLSPSKFSSYELVLSGHYHTRSSDGPIRYTGTPFELTWNDYDDPKGFYILDSETLELEFIENTDKIHRKVLLEDGVDVDIDELKDCIVKVIVKEEFDGLEDILDSIFRVSYDTVVIDTSVAYTVDDSTADIENKSTLDIILESVETSDDLDPSILKKMMTDLYSEALA